MSSLKSFGGVLATAPTMIDRLFARLYVHMHYSRAMILHVATYGLDPYEKRRFTQSKIAAIESLCHEKARTECRR